ncbi:hypothetical protein Q3V37_01870 [Micromonospora profundi]|uniref:Uncharacterized protein n=1 Tax=Micromonospora profundi TaxID=1420889 RepID=A0AAJ6L3D3_9ACTN|nr:hypothetical protein [Micromonospora profundi]WLS46061.1 hypothetical protein Q3V37_01870 [Micromonospora profundi]
MESGGLRQAYGGVLAELDAGEFGAAPAGQLSAEQIVAHLVANDELMIQATEALLAGSPYAYYDLDDMHRPQLDALVAEQGGMRGLTALLHGTSERLCALVDQLGLNAETPVATCLREGPDLDIDEPLPWSRTLNLHAKVHLPKHQAQLHALRTNP